METTDIIEVLSLIHILNKNTIQTLIGMLIASIISMNQKGGK